MPNYRGVRIHKGEIEYRLRFDGVDYRERGFASQRDAYQAREERLRILRGGGTDGRKHSRGSATVGDVRADWIQRSTAKPSTVAGYQRDWSAYLSKRFARVPVGAIVSDDVDAWARSLLNSGIARGTVRRARWQLKSILDLAVSQGLPRNPVDAAPLPKARRGDRPTADPRARFRILDRTEIDVLASAIDPRFRAWVYIGAYLGLRPGEIAGLSIHQIDRAARTITVDQAVRWTHDSEGRQTGVELVAELKTDGAFRTVSYGPTVAEAIERHLDEVGVADDGRLFYFSGNRARGRQGLVSSSSGGFRRLWSEAQSATGIDLRPYDLRHTAATLAVEAGVPLNRVAAMLGDSVQTVSAHYVQTIPTTHLDAAAIEGERHLRAVGSD